jgi:hypothetical protein
MADAIRIAEDRRAGRSTDRRSSRARRGGAIVQKIIESAEAGDVDARREFFRYLLPHPKLVLTPIDLEPVKDAAEAQAQIGMLTSMAARGELDLDSLHALSRALALAIDPRLAELEENCRRAGKQ